MSISFDFKELVCKVGKEVGVSSSIDIGRVDGRIGNGVMSHEPSVTEVFLQKHLLRLRRSQHGHNALKSIRQLVNDHLLTPDEKEAVQNILRLGFGDEQELASGLIDDVMEMNHRSDSHRPQ